MWFNVQVKSPLLCLYHPSDPIGAWQITTTTWLLQWWIQKSLYRSVAPWFMVITVRHLLHKFFLKNCVFKITLVIFKITDSG